MSDFDLVVRSGTVADGSGAELFDADIGIEGGKIVAVGVISVGAPKNSTPGASW
jgi:N-acyl-D-amino-acid deacylase